MKTNVFATYDFYTIVSDSTPSFVDVVCSYSSATHSDVSAEVRSHVDVAMLIHLFFRFRLKEQQELVAFFQTIVDGQLSGEVDSYLLDGLESLHEERFLECLGKLTGVDYTAASMQAIAAEVAFKRASLGDVTDCKEGRNV